MTNDTSTLNGALTELGETMADNLVSMGVTGADPSDGLTTLAGKILDIAPSVGGITPVVTIDISKTPSGTIYAGDTVLITCKVNADYDDQSQLDIDLHGYLQGATLTIKNSGTTLGTCVSDSTGIATYTISNIQEGNYSITSHFDGTGTDYESATSSALTFTVEATPDWYDAGVTGDSKASQYGNFGSAPTINVDNDGTWVTSSGGERWAVIPVDIASTDDFVLTFTYVGRNNSKDTPCIELSQSSSNRQDVVFFWSTPQKWTIVINGSNTDTGYGLTATAGSVFEYKRVNGTFTFKIDDTLIYTWQSSSSGRLAIESYADGRYIKWKDLILQIL